jgi:hypothetical protein
LGKVLYIKSVEITHLRPNLRREKRRMNRAEGALGLGSRRLLARCLSLFSYLGPQDDPALLSFGFRLNELSNRDFLATITLT